MTARSSVLLIFILFITACQNNSTKSEQFMELPEVYSETIKNLIAFFDENGFEPENLVYYSEIDNEGKITSDKIYTVALNRLIYGLSYTSRYFPENYQKAEHLTNFLMQNLIGTDSIGDFFISFIEGDHIDASPYLDVWQQAYGLCGLTEFYRTSPSEELLSTIHQLFDAFIMRFHDPVNGGFYGSYNMETGSISGSKSLQSLMYPITAFLGNLWLADTLNRDKYEPYIKENLDLLYKAAWNTETNWVNIKFKDDWTVCESPDKSKPCFTVSPGHNFQLATLFLRSKTWTFLNQETKTIYQAKGREIINSTLHKPIFGNKHIGNGFISLVNPHTDEVLDDRKTWWQHAEAIIALSMCKNTYVEELKQLETFYFKNFQDHQNKGEFFYLDNNNRPITTELKGSMGKSTYHTIEMIRFLMEK